MLGGSAGDPEALRGFFDELPASIDHVLITAGAPRYVPMLEMTADKIRATLPIRRVVGPGDVAALACT